eukprot:2154074-Alexandrium_andersonii.AAC.1
MPGLSQLAQWAKQPPSASASCLPASVLQRCTQFAAVSSSCERFEQCLARPLRAPRIAQQAPPAHARGT